MIRTDFRTRRRAERRTRGGLSFLFVAALIPGVWGVISPRSFFADFPGFGFHWVASHPPFNEHLVRDTASFYLAFALLFLAGAVTLGPRLVRGVLAGWLVFAVLHLLFHWRAEADLGAAEGLGLLVSLVALVLLPLYLLVSAGKVDTRHN